MCEHTRVVRGGEPCGTHSVLAQLHGPGPLTAHNVAEMDILTYDGARFRREVFSGLAGKPRDQAGDEHPD